jgi:hypothetical protein
VVRKAASPLVSVQAKHQQKKFGIMERRLDNVDKLRMMG